VIAERDELPASGVPTLASLGVDQMTTEQLAALAQHLQRLSSWVGEYRFLQLEAAHNWRERIPNRPTIGYYLQLQKKSA
jgi:hypothetical protein